MPQARLVLTEIAMSTPTTLALGIDALALVAASDGRRVTACQDFVDDTPRDLLHVADHRRMATVPVGQRERSASACAGAIAQTVGCPFP